MKPLFLTAHYDDLEVCAGGTAERYGGTSIVFHPHEDHGKEEEAEEAAFLLGIETVNAKRHASDRDMIAWLDFVAEPFDTIVSTSPYDSHPEHQAVASLARQVARRNNMGLWFMDHAIPGGFGNGPRPNRFVKFGKTSKYEAMRSYRGMMRQYGSEWPSAVACRDRYYGWMHDGYYAEGFIVENQIT